MAESGRQPPANHAHEDDDPSAALMERLAHDLRGPLSPLQTAAYLLRCNDIDPGRQQELLEVIDRQTTRLSAMVQEVSDWTRARQARLLDHRGLIGATMLVELACAAKDPALRLDLPETLDAVMIDGDAQRLAQMLSTLVGFVQGRAGDAGIVVEAEPSDRGLRIVVGAPAATWADGERETLFSKAQELPFDEGLGMRLLLANAIAQAHGGELVASDRTVGGVWLELLLPSSP